MHNIIHNEPSNNESAFNADSIENYYNYINHRWLASNPVPPELSRYGHLDKINDAVNKDLISLICDINLSTASEKYGERQLKQLFNSGISSNSRRKNGVAVLCDLLTQIFAIDNKVQLPSTLATIHGYGDDSFWGIAIDYDMLYGKNTAIYLRSSGLGLWNKEYYFLSSFTSIREAYKDLLYTLFSLIGKSDIEKRVANVMRVECELAKATNPILAPQDLSSAVTVIDVEEMNNIYGGFSFSEYFENRGISNSENIIILCPNYLSKVVQYLNIENLDLIKDYIAAHLLINFSWYLSDDFIACVSDFYDSVLHGKQKTSEKKIRAIGLIDELMGDALGKLYLKKYISIEAIADIKELCSSLKCSFQKLILSCQWMSTPTKGVAVKKLKKMKCFVAGPESITDYSSLVLDDTKTYFENVLKARSWKWQTDLKYHCDYKRKAAWDISPQTPNAYYNPFINAVFIPAAIIQYPFYNGSGLNPSTIGSIGCIIGHEMTHSLDYLGKQFSEDGELKEWWCVSDEEKYSCIILNISEQFKKKRKLNDDLRHGLCSEILADIGGVNIALKCLIDSSYYKHYSVNKKKSALYNFFAAFARGWATNYTDKELEYLEQNDVHPDAEIRVNLALSNNSIFQNLYKVEEGNGMWISERMRIELW